MLRGFHVTEKIRVVDDAGHVSLGEFHAADSFEFTGHGRILDRGFGICELKSVFGFFESRAL